MIKRDVFTWGVRLSVSPFTSGENQALAIQSEISNYKQGRGSEIRITFNGVSLTPLRIIDAQTWKEAFGAIIDETRSVAAEMKNVAEAEAAAAAAKAAKPAKSAKSTKSAKKKS